MTLIFTSLCLFAFLAALNITPLVRDLALRMKLVDYPDRRRKFHAQPVPRLGGVAVLLSYIVAFGGTFVGFKNAEFVLPSESVAWGLLLAILLIFLVGLLDDIIGLRPWQKLVGQFAAAVVAYLSGAQVHVLGGHAIAIWLSLPLSIGWLVLCSNAFNLIDGLDGLAAGVGLFATVAMVIAAITDRDLGLALATVPLAGCLLGFLRYNFNPASIFLGDCGSLTIGFFLGCCGTLWGQKSATALGMAAPLMAMVIPLLDAIVALGRRFLRGQPLFAGDHRHIHHLLLERGLSPQKVVLLLYGLCALAGALSLIQNALDQKFGGLVLILFCAGAWVGVQYLGYSEFGLATQLLKNDTFRRTIDLRFRLQQFEQSFETATTVQECWDAAQAGCREFGFSGCRVKLRGQTLTGISGNGTDSHWQMRIQLPDSQYVNIYCGAVSGAELSGLADFASALERSLRRRLPQLAPPSAESSLSGLHRETDPVRQQAGHSRFDAPAQEYHRAAGAQ